MRKLDFPPIKTTEQFLENYKMHDRALKIVEGYFRQNQFTIIPYGSDRRTERVWGEDKPDRLAWQNGYWLFLFDVKGHSGNTWMVNERAYYTYLRYSNLYKIPVICIWVNLATEDIWYAEVPFPDAKHEHMPHDKNKVVKTKSTQPIDRLIGRLWMLAPEDIPFE